MGEQCTAFQYLVALEEAFPKMATCQIKKQPEQLYWLGLCFQAGDNLFVTKPQYIEAVNTSEQLYDLPISHHGLIGMSQYHHRVFPVLDAGHLLLAQQSPTHQPNTRIIIYRFYDQWVGLHVDVCHGMKRFEMSQFQKTFNTDHPFAEFTLSHFKTKDQIWHIIDLYKLISQYASQNISKIEFL